MTPSPAPAARDRIPELDGVRGLAIFLVILWHYVASPLRFFPQTELRFFAHLFRLSWSGVDLFFVLSGFLIGGILLDHARAPHYFRAFYARRTLRILPLYYGWVALFFLVPVVLPALASHPPLQPLFTPSLPAWSYLTFTQNLVMVQLNGFGADWMAITWSLAVEEQFYLLLPLLIRLVPERWLPAALISLGLLAPVLRLLAGPDQFYIKYVLMQCRADALFLGVLCAWALRQDRWRERLLRSRRALYGVAFVIFGSLGVLCFLPLPQLEKSAFLYTALAFGFASLLLLAVTAPASLVGRFFRFAPLRGMGILAYGLYLLHQTVSRLAHGLILDRKPGLDGLAPIAVTLFSALVTWAIAALSWRYFEKPLVTLGHKVSYEAPARDSSPAPPAAAPSA